MWPRLSWCAGLSFPASGVFTLNGLDPMLLGFLLVVLVLVCIAMSAVILMQRSEGGALGLGGSPSGILTVSGAGDLLTRTTSVLAAVFFMLCLLLTVVQGHSHVGGSVVDKMSVKALSGAALNAAAHRPGTAPPAVSGQTSGSTSAPLPAAASFDAPAPQVHSAPVGSSSSSGKSSGQ
jgi:preprotein translocase subunit SecG